VLQRPCGTLKEVTGQVFEVLTLDAAAEVFAVKDLLDNEGSLCVCTEDLLCAPCLCEKALSETCNDYFVHLTFGATIAT